MRALYTAATGMAAQELNVQVISNNIANMRTTGFKRQRAEFQDLMYQNLRRVGSNTSNQAQAPGFGPARQSLICQIKCLCRTRAAVVLLRRMASRWLSWLEVDPLLQVLRLRMGAV